MTPTTLRAAMRTVESMVGDEVPFEHIEAYIEACAELEENERAVLWLYAWLGGEPQMVAAELGRVGCSTMQQHG